VSTLGMPRGVIKARASTSGETMSTIEILFQSRVREPITDHPTKICNQHLKSEHTGDFVHYVAIPGMCVQEKSRHRNLPSLPA